MAGKANEMEVEKHKWKSNFKILGYSILIALIGLVIFYLTFGNNDFWYVLGNQIGISIIAIGVLSIVWQAVLERTFADEIFAKARMSENIKISGISEINENFTKIEWADLLNSAKNIDLFFIWAQTWTNMYRDELKAISQKKDVKIRLILPDPTDEQTLESLMDRMKVFDTGYIKNKILETKKTYEEEIFNKNAHLEIWLIKKPLLFSIYRFDNQIIFALSSHRTDKPSVPTFKFGEGPISEFLYNEIIYLTESEYSTKVYDNKTNN